ncbi:hypothetical protein MCOR34_003919 [Pyricularia oryzae]|nr:hypothetical protein MCOR34_003919 [Pyricularia oryzae]KAI6448358.1 hypothetical protein MCOR17_010347 [Pyricularia oryzae]KAI6485073.1 hypothetical protein MCOR13_009790 [Pyricularia oryzae]KAI6584646.1 hypothetical protein MCOR04_004902 [Pyricularia oryzae]
MGIDRCNSNGFAGTWDTIAPQRSQLAVLLPWELNGRYEIAAARIGGTKDFFLLAHKVKRSKPGQEFVKCVSPTAEIAYAVTKVLGQSEI